MKRCFTYNRRFISFRVQVYSFAKVFSHPRIYALKLFLQKLRLAETSMMLPASCYTQV